MASRTPEELRENLQHFALISQPSDLPVICTACSLVNALALRGERVSSSEANTLIDRVIEKHEPLSLKDDQDFVAKYGYALRPWAPPEEQISTVPLALETIHQFLQTHSPVIFKLSTYLSKRDRSVPARETFTTNLELIHRVVALAEDDTFGIVDPYQPYSPELFVWLRQDERERLLVWMFSVFFQHQLAKSEALTKELLLTRGFELMGSPAKFSNFAIFGFLQAGFQYLAK